MNYTVLVIGAFALAMTLAWFMEGRKLFSPPVDDEAIIIGTNVMTEAENNDIESSGSIEYGKGGCKA